MTSGTSVVPFVKKSSTLPAIDSANYCQPPLDYSYYKISNLQDIYDEEPRINLSQKKTAPHVNKEQKSGSRCLRINNNALTEITILSEIVGSLFKEPAALGWLDLSFNELTGIDKILTELTGLEILYLHGNQISSLNEVDKLQSLTSLRKLTLHGNNSIETIKGYRQYVLALIPWLMSFDFSPVTKADRKTAETWERMNKTPKKKKKEA